MISSPTSDYRPNGAEFPDDFPQRLERLRQASDLTWSSLARDLGVSVRSLYRWRAGTRPDAAHMLAIVEFATEQELLDLLLTRNDEVAGNNRQAVLFADDVWEGLGDEGTASARGDRIRCAT